MMHRRTLLAGAAALAAPLAAPRLGRAQASPELTFYYPIAVGGPLQAIIDGYCTEYKAQTGVTVNPVYAGTYGEALTKATTAIRAGQGPHFAVLLAAEMHSLQDAGILASLDEIGGDGLAEWTGGFYPAFMANSVIDGRIWSVPFQRSTMIAYYNKRAFEQAGLDPEAFPRDWTALAEAAQRLTESKDGRVTRWGIKIAGDLGNAQWSFGALANQAGQMLMNQAGNETYFDAPKTVEALTYWRDLATRYQAAPPGISAWPTLSPDFLEGNTAIIWHTTGNLTNLRDKASFPFGVAGVPGRDGPRTVVGGGNVYFFKHANAAERAASLRFVRWLTAPERAADWSMRTGYIATSPAAYDTASIAAFVQRVPAAAVARTFLPVATGELSTFENQRIQKVLTDRIQAVLNGTMQPGPAMQEAQAESARILRPYL